MDRWMDDSKTEMSPKIWKAIQNDKDHKGFISGKEEELWTMKGFASLFVSPSPIMQKQTYIKLL